MTIVSCITSSQKGLCGLRVHEVPVTHLLLSRWFQESLESIYWWCIDDYFFRQTVPAVDSTQWEKAQSWISVATSFLVCPRVQLSVAIWKYVDTGMSVNPCINLYTSIKSDLLRLSSKGHSFRAFSRASYVMTLRCICVCMGHVAWSK